MPILNRIKPTNQGPFQATKERLYHWQTVKSEVDGNGKVMTSRARTLRIVEAFVDCNDVLEDQARLRSRAAENGYLYFPGLLPVEDVLPVRRGVLQVVGRHGLLRAGIDIDEGIRKEGVYIDLEYDKPTPPELKRFYNEVLSLHSFNAFPHHATVMGLLESLLAEPTFVHPRQ